jgi:hypothetical protein
MFISKAAVVCGKFKRSCKIQAVAGSKKSLDCEIKINKSISFLSHPSSRIKPSAAT